MEKAKLYFNMRYYAGIFSASVVLCVLGHDLWLTQKQNTACDRNLREYRADVERLHHQATLRQKLTDCQVAYLMSVVHFCGAFSDRNVSGDEFTAAVLKVAKADEALHVAELAAPPQPPATNPLAARLAASESEMARKVSAARIHMKQFGFGVLDR